MSEASRILIVDDEPAIREMIATTCKKLGFEPTLAEDGFAALVIARATPFKLIFTDYKMPRINGLHLCRHLRLTLTNERTPIIMCSAALEELDTETLQQNVSPITFLPKPVDLLLLPSLIQSAIKQSLDPA